VIFHFPHCVHPWTQPYGQPVAVQIVYPDDLSFSVTYVTKNGSISIMLHGHL